MKSNASSTDPRVEALWVASRYGNLSSVQQLLADASLGFDIDAANKVGETALFLAAENGFHDIVRLLLDAGAKIDTPCPYFTPLQRACSSGHLHVVIEMVDRAKCDPHWVAGKVSKTLGDCVCDAAHRGQLSMLEYLLQNGADLDFVDRAGNTAVRFAASAGQLEVIKYLHSKGASLATERRDGGTTPLYNALRCRDEPGAAIADYIMQHTDVHNSKLDDGFTLLHAAAGAHHVSLVQQLIANKAEINARDRNGETPLFAAADFCPRDVTERATVLSMLIAAGADINAKTHRGDSIVDAALRPRHGVRTPTKTHLVIPTLLAAGATLASSKQLRDYLFALEVEEPHRSCAFALLRYPEMARNVIADEGYDHFSHRTLPRFINAIARTTFHGRAHLLLWYEMGGWEAETFQGAD